jgi:hypothetical protein
LKLDFSEFHPLDHSFLACRGYPGGPRRHFSYDWEFRVRPWLRARTLCRLGRHHEVKAWGRKAVGEPWFTWTACSCCAHQFDDKTPGEPPRFMNR